MIVDLCSGTGTVAEVAATLGMFLNVKALLTSSIFGQYL